MSFRKTLYALTVLGLCASGALAQQSSPLPDSALQQTPAKPPMLGAFSEIKGDHVLGSAAAPVTFIIYASITCPHCSHWFKTAWRDIKVNYVDTNKVRIVFREFPTQPANLAVAGFQIANCAPEKKYFALIEHQMLEQDNIITAVQEGKGLETYLAIAKRAGLKNETEMNACFTNEKGQNRISKAMKLAVAGDIHSVPSFIVNGSVYKQNSDYMTLSKHFDSLLAQGYSPIPNP